MVYCSGSNIPKQEPFVLGDAAENKTERSVHDRLINSAWQICSTRREVRGFLPWRDAILTGVLRGKFRSVAKLHLHHNFCPIDMKYILALALLALCIVTVSTRRIHREKQKVLYDSWGYENDARGECTTGKKAGESCNDDGQCCSRFCDHTGKCITIAWSNTMLGSLIMTLMYCSTFSDYIATG